MKTTELSKRLLIAILLLVTYASPAQHIVTGPVVGGMTHESARIYVRTDSPKVFTLQLSEDNAFSNPVEIIDSTTADKFRVRIVDVEDLIPRTLYYYRFVFSGSPDSLSGRFRTFPAPDEEGYYKIVVGSCNYHDNFPLFQSIRDFDPDVFLHLGDWNYPPSAPGLGWDYNLYPNERAESFAVRFSDNNMKQFVQPYIPVDYIYDDDYSHNNVEGSTVPKLDVMRVGSFATNNFYTQYLDSNIRYGAISAYADNFPGYELVDSAEGIFHNFKLGNIEIFMTDGRLPKSPSHDPFIFDSSTNQWTFQPGPEHSMLGASQREWLMDELQNSTATWKLVGNGVVFNKQYRRILDLGLQFQSLALTIAGVSGSGATLASQMAYNWVGYPVDQDSLIALYESGRVKNLVMLSGDTHSSMIDDGTNAGIPELSASGLAAGDEGTLNYYLDSVGQILGQPPVGDSLWNGGGNGVGNANFSDTWGKIEVFGDDSLRMCVIDELEQTLGCVTLYNAKTDTTTDTTGVSSRITLPDETILLVYPNPTKDRIRVWVNQNENNSKASIYIHDLSGKQVLHKELSPATRFTDISLQDFSSGTYILTYQSGKHGEERKFVVR